MTLVPRERDLDLKLGEADRVLVFAPHPDDESLAVGGLLQRAAARGAAVRVLFATDGENNPWAQRAVERRWRIGPADRARWGVRRRREALAALDRLGVGAGCAAFLGLPDQGLTDLLLGGGEAAIRTLAAHLRLWPPTLLLQPSITDVHPDHSALAVAAHFAQARLPATRRGFLAASFVVHSRRPEDSGLWTRVRLRPDEREVKGQAIRMHASQLRLRGGYMLGFAGDDERFALGTRPRLRAPDHPVWEAYVAGGVLHAGLDRGHRFGVGPAALLVVVEDPGRCCVRLALRMTPRSGRVELRDAITGACWGQVPPGEDGSGVRLEIPLPGAGLTSRAGCYIKLERPAERRLGLFDRHGWRAVPLLDPVIAEAGEQAPARIVKVEALPSPA